MFLEVPSDLQVLVEPGMWASLKPEKLRRKRKDSVMCMAALYVFEYARRL